MSYRNELAAYLNAFIMQEASCWAQTGEEAADAILAALDKAGYRKPRTVTTAEELDALPVGSVVLHGSRSFQRYAPRIVPGFEYHKWMCPDGGFVHAGHDGDMILPATVLHTPEPQS